MAHAASPYSPPSRGFDDSFVSNLKGMMKVVNAWFATSAAKQTESEVGDFIQQHGGVLTDELEREISRRFGNMAG